MTRLALVLTATLAVATSAGLAEETRVATFENFTEGESFKPSFTDPVSGIFFHGSTHPSDGFVIDYSATSFGGGNNLTSGGIVPGPTSAWGADFGFAGILPALANRVSIDVSHPYPGYDNPAGVILRGFNESGDIVAQQSGPSFGPDPFAMQISTSNYEIARFQIEVYAGFSAAYDNIRFTVPEPTSALWGLLMGPAILAQRGLSRARLIWSNQVNEG